MIAFAPEFLAALGRSTLLLAAAALLVAGWLRLWRPASPGTERAAWLLVLLVGVIWWQIPVAIPWFTPAAVERVATSDVVEPLVLPNRSHRSAESPGALLAARSATLNDNVPPTTAHGGWSRQQVAFLGWLSGFVLVGIGGLLRYVAFVGRVGRLSRLPIEPEWSAEWSAVGAGSRRLPTLQITRDLGPLLVILPGGARVLVPEPLWKSLAPAARQAILRHELAHHRRGDVWMMLLARLLAWPHWFNPFAWWTVRHLEAATEWSCDRAAVPDPADRPAFASALLQLGQPPSPLTAIGAASHLATRIHRVLTPEAREESSMRKFVMLVLPALLIVAASLRVELVARAAVQRDDSHSRLKEKRPLPPLKAVAWKHAPSLQQVVDQVVREIADLRKEIAGLETRSKEQSQVYLAADRAYKSNLNDESLTPQQRARLEADLVATQKEYSDTTTALVNKRRQLASAEQKRQRMAQDRMRNLKPVADRILKSNDPAATLEVCLTFLQHPTGETQFPLDWLAPLARVKWQPQPGEPVPAMLARLENAALQSKDQYLVIFRDRAAAFSRLGLLETPFDWRVRKSHWFSLVADLIESQSPRQASVVWSSPARQAQYGKLVCCHCYHAVLRTMQNIPTNVALLTNDGRDQDVEHVGFALALALETLDIAGNQRLSAPLVKRLVDRQESGGVIPAPLIVVAAAQPGAENILGRLLGRYRQNPSQRYHMELLLQSLVDFAPPNRFHNVCFEAGFPIREMQQWFKRKNVNVGFAGRGFRNVFDQIERDVRLPIMIDDVNRRRLHPVSLSASAPWDDVFREVLRQAELVCIEMPDGMLRVIPGAWAPGARAEYHRLVNDSLARCLDKGDLQRSLQLPTSVDFRDMPASDGLTFLSEFSGINVVKPTLAHDVGLNCWLASWPMHLALTRVAEIAGLDWLGLHGVVFVDVPKQIANYRARSGNLAAKRETLERLGGDHKIAKSLTQPVVLDFKETPMGDVVEFLHEYSGSPFLSLDEPPFDTPVTLRLEGVALRAALEIMTMRHDLDWDTDGHVGVVAVRARVAEYMRLAATRAERLRAMANKNADLLRRTIAYDAVQMDVARGGALLAQQTGRKVGVGGKTFEAPTNDTKAKTFRDLLPLHVLLDLLAVRWQTGPWKLADDGAIVFGKRE